MVFLEDGPDDHDTTTDLATVVLSSSAPQRRSPAEPEPSLDSTEPSPKESLETQADMF